MCGIESAVSNVIVGSLYGPSALSLEKNSLVGTLWVALPEYAVCNKKAAGISDGNGKFVFRKSLWPLQRDEPIVCHCEALVC